MFTQVTALLLKEALAMPTPPAPPKPASGPNGAAQPPVPIKPPPTGAQTMPSPTAAMPSISQ